MLNMNLSRPKEPMSKFNLVQSSNKYAVSRCNEVSNAAISTNV